MSARSSILAWKIPWTEEPGGLPSMGPQRVKHDRAAEHEHSLISSPCPAHRGDLALLLVTTLPRCRLSSWLQPHARPSRTIILRASASTHVTDPAAWLPCSLLSSSTAVFLSSLLGRPLSGHIAGHSQKSLFQNPAL